MTATNPNLVSSLSEADIHGMVLLIEEGDRQEVRGILAAVSRKLLAVPVPPKVARTRLEMVIACLIEVVDALDGDAELEDGHDAEIVCEDEGAQCDDEGHEESGIADADGVEEQGFSGLAERLHLIQAAALYAAQNRE